MIGSSQMHANARRNRIMAGTGISVSAILPKKNPVPHRHPAVARARMGMTRPCGSNIASDSRAGVNEHPSGTVRNFIGLQSRLARVREIQVGNTRRIAAKAETTGYGQAPHRAFDWQPRGRLDSAVECPAPQRCVPASRFQQWSFQRSSVPIIRYEAAMGQMEAALVFPERFVRCQSIRQRPPPRINLTCRRIGHK